MGSACCSKNVEENEGLLAIQIKSLKNTREHFSPIPIIEKGYRSIPNRFKSESPRKEALIGLAGLENLGNTCFISAVVQCLSNCQPMTDYFISGLYEQELRQKIELTICFAEIICTQWMDSFEVIIPKRFIELIFESSAAFEPESQHDAQEFLLFLLNFLSESLNREGQTAVGTVKLQGIKGDELEAAKAWKDHLIRETSIIVDLFQGQFKSILVCKECSEMRCKFEVFMSLSVEIPRLASEPSLEDCLRNFTKNESLDECWFCPRCKKYVEAYKKIDIWKVPNVLIIHLKRFRYTPDGHGKIRKTVTFPVNGLDLSPFLSGPQKEPPVYDLFAKIDHEGKLSSGHYTASAKNRRDNSWYTFDDAQVIKISDTEVVNESAYVLMYHKNSVSEFCRQSKNMPENWPHFDQTRNSDMRTMNKVIVMDKPKIETNELKLNISNNPIKKMIQRQRSDDSLGTIPQPSYYFN